MKIIFALGIIWILSVGVIIYSILTAPTGYEDEEGFHYSEDYKNKDKKL